MDDIDLFPGGIAERLVPGGLTGPTFACIIGRQFRNSKVGDRFWHERPDRITGFSEGNEVLSQLLPSCQEIFCNYGSPKHSNVSIVELAPKE